MWIDLDEYLYDSKALPLQRGGIINADGHIVMTLSFYFQ